MFTNAKWIGRAPGELGRRADEKLTDEQAEALKERALAGEDPTYRGSLLFRRDFTLPFAPCQAVLSVAGLGFYRLTVNGAAPDPARAFAPITSDYERRVKYDDYSVAPLLRQGENCLCAEVGPGWFTGNPKYWGWQQTWYGNPRLLLELTVRGAEGEELRVVTDGGWKLARGTVLSSCIYDGETQDLSLAPPDWDLPGFDAAAWRQASVTGAPGGELTLCAAPPVRVARVLQPAARRELSATETLFDFGENGAGVPYVTVRGAKGDTVTLRHAEFLTPEGLLDTRSENRALCTDTFILADGRPVTLSPRFTWHGYRYMTVSRARAETELLGAESGVVHSDVPVTGSFVCGSEELNELHRAYVRTLLACLQGVPVDCPQRDERKAWLGDAWAASEACLYNFDMRAFYADWLEDLRVCAHPEHKYIPFICPTFGNGSTSIDWNTAYPAILKECCERYGDLALARRHYPALKAHTEYYVSQAKDGLPPPCWFGDWCTPALPAGQQKVAFCAGGEDHRQNPPFAAALFYAQTLRLTAELAELLGNTEDAAYFRARREETRQALLQKYFDRDTGRFGGGGQFLQTFLLAENLTDKADRPAAKAALLREIKERDHHPYVGVMGLRRIYDVLVSLGKPETAWRVFTARGYPGQLYMLTGGRTTLTECLDLTGSGDHCMFASPDAFFYKHLCGIRIDRTQSVPVTVSPYSPADLPFARASVLLPEGEVYSAWERAGDTVTFDVRVPEGLPARLLLRTRTGAHTELLPAGGSRRVTLKEFTTR